jgi:hypothetical protein
MRLYITGPMTGLPDFNRPAFQRTTRILRSLGHWVMDPTELDSLPTKVGEVDTWVWKLFLSRDVAMLLSVELDGMVLLDGWERSRGSRLEVLTALLAGIRLYALKAPVRKTYYLEQVLVGNINVTDLEPY